jgi:pimeloyl-ACP methyl ester carboxylesterase
MNTETSTIVTSKDGTRIAYEKQGEGPAVILITGALGVRMSPDLAERLAEHFTVYNFDRRGRGNSSDTLPYAVEREIEDIEALIDESGKQGGTGSAYLFGISSGAALALEAANKLGVGKVTKQALYETIALLRCRQIMCSRLLRWQRRADGAMRWRSS